MAGARWDDEGILELHRRLVQAGVLVEVELGGPDEALWIDCELASLAENRLGEIVDPRDVDEARRRWWRARATTERIWRPSQRSDLDRCYWLRDGAETAGTIALATTTLGGSRLNVSSLYVVPAHRGRGLATRALTQVRDVLGSEGLTLRLSTSWCWQRTLGFYLRLGMWVWMWKRELDLRWKAAEPSPCFEVTGDVAILRAGPGGRVLATAHRDGDRLVLDEASTLDGERDELWWDAMTTLSVYLALHGWPLIRSQAHWERDTVSDAVAPEALAYKISIWEAWDRFHGFRVETPRVPGLVYPTWPELELRWAAEAERHGLSRR